MERRKSHPSVEIELVDESSGDVGDACPESFGSPQYNEDKQGEPTLYKRVIYVPSNANSRAEVVEQHQPKDSPSLKYCVHNAYGHDEKWDGDVNTTPAEAGRRCRDGDIPCDHGSVLTEHAAASEASMDNLKSDANILASYWKQWADGFHPGVALSALLVSVMHFVWILALGSWLGNKTREKIGTAEVFLSTFMCGAVFAAAGSQQVLIVGVSVPALVFVSAVFTTADRLSLNFLPWMGWIAIWSAALLAIMASLMSCGMSLAGQVTQFSWEVVQMFVGLTLMWHGVEETVHLFSGDASDDSALLSLWLVTCAFLVGILLDGTRHSHFLSGRSRQILADFGPAFVVLALLALPGIPKLARIKLSRVHMPRRGYHSDGYTKLGSLVRLKAVPFWAIFLAFIPGALLAALVLIDHDSTSTLLTSDSEELRKQKNLSRRRDLLILSGILFLCGLLGLPFCYGLFPQSIRHIHGLTSKMTISSSDLESQDVFIHRCSRGKVRVQRVSSLLVSLIIGIPLLPKVALLVKKVPQPLLLGYCLQMGLLSFQSLRFTEYSRIAFFEHSPSEGPSLIAVRLYIITQIGCVATVFVVSCTQAALIFPLFLLTAVWLRHYVMGRVFQKPEFEMLDRKLFPGKHDNNPDPMSVNPLDYSQQQVHSWLQSNSIPAQRQETSGSSFSRHSIHLASEVKTRRLKERSLRRKKRKRYPSFEDGGHMTPVSVSGRETTKSRYKREQGSWGSLSASLRFLMGSRDNSCSLSRNDSNTRGLSRFRKRARNKSMCLSLRRGDLDVDIHSNVLYDPYWGDAIVVSSENAMFDELKGEHGDYADSRQIILQQQDHHLLNLDKHEQILSLMGPHTPPECIDGSKARHQKKQKQKQPEDDLLSEDYRLADDTLIVSRGLRRATMSFDEWANASDNLSVGTIDISSVMASASTSTSDAAATSFASSSSSSSHIPVAADSICIGAALPYALIIPAISLTHDNDLNQCNS